MFSPRSPCFSRSEDTLLELLEQSTGNPRDLERFLPALFGFTKFAVEEDSLAVPGLQL